MPGYLKLNRDWVYHYWPKLTLIEKAVIIVLLTHLSQKTNACFPSQKLISQEANISIRAVVKAVKGLEEKGVITKDDTRTPKGWKRNIYKL